MRKIPKYGTQNYWKTTDSYTFDLVKGKEKLNVFAHSPKAANIKAKNWEKWLVKTGRGNEKVDLSSIKMERRIN